MRIGRYANDVPMSAETIDVFDTRDYVELDPKQGTFHLVGRAAGDAMIKARGERTDLHGLCRRIEENITKCTASDIAKRRDGVLLDSNAAGDRHVIHVPVDEKANLHNLKGVRDMLPR